MPKPHRVMIRLSPALYAQLEARGSHGQPLAAIVRQALVDYLTQQPEEPASSHSSHEQPPELREQLVTMAASLQELHAQVDALTARLDALAAPQQPQAATSSRTTATEQPRAANSPLPPYDATRFVLGTLCPRGHDYGGTGQSLRRRHNGGCAQCNIDQQRERRQARRQGAP
jgi:hypothetical protein